jgi:hypothetical protein
MYFGFSCNKGKAADPLYGEIIEPGSSCYISSLTKKGNRLNAERASCYRTSCDYTTKGYNVTILFDTSYTTVCPKEGGKVSVRGLDGEFLCPDFNLICTQKDTICSDAIECINKKVLETPSVYDYKPVGNFQSFSSFRNSLLGSGFMNVMRLMICFVFVLELF